MEVVNDVKNQLALFNGTNIEDYNNVNTHNKIRGPDLCIILEMIMRELSDLNPDSKTFLSPEEGKCTLV